MAIAATPMLNGWTEGSSESSPDPLTLSSNTFPKLTTPIRARSKTPASKRPLRSIKKELTLGDTVDVRASPSKSITMDMPGNSSPWRVTVQAQPLDDDVEVDNHNFKPPPKRKFATEILKTTIPMKDADENPPKKPRRSSGASTGVRKRKSTPTRGRSGRKLDTTPLLSDINVGSSPMEKPRRRRSLSRNPSQPSTTAVPTHGDEAGQLPQNLDGGQNTIAAPAPATKIPPKRDQSSVFDFAALTPLYQKDSLPAPEAQGRFQEAQQEYKQRRTGVVPQGWSALVFSPLPPRSSLVRKIAEGDESSLLNDEEPIRAQEASHQRPAAFTEVNQINSPIFSRKVNHYEDAHDDEALEDMDPGGEVDADKESDAHDEADAELWKKMIKQSNEFEDERAAPDGASETVSEDEDFAMAGEITGVVGDATMMQSEEFSMVSISSLPSAKDLCSRFVENGGVKPSRTETTERQSKQSSPHSTGAALTTTGANISPQPPERENSPLTNERSLRCLPLKETPITASEAMLDASQDISIASELGTPGQASSSIQDMSSIMRSWRRNLPPQEQSFMTEPQGKDTPTNRNLSTVTVESTTKRNLQILPPDLSPSNLPLNEASATRDHTPDVVRLPTPDSAEKDPYTARDQSPHIGESQATYQNLRSRLQEAASEQLRNESERAYANETDVSMEGEPEPSVNNSSLLREAQWQREREEVIRQAKEANQSRIIVIDSDSEDEEDGEQDEEPQQRWNNDIDIWQEEASRSTDLDEHPSKQKVRGNFRSSLEQSEHSLSYDQAEPMPRPSKVSRSWQRISASDASFNRGGNGEHSVDETSFRETSIIESQRVRQKDNNAAISSLFKSITGKSQSPIKERREKEDEVKEDETLEDEVSTLSKSNEIEEEEDDMRSLASFDVTGMFRHRNLPTLFSQVNDRIATQDSTRSMNDSTQLTHRPGASMLATSAISPTKPNSTMLSDVRQLHREMHLASDHHTTVEEVSTGLVAEKSYTTYASRPMLHLSPKRQSAKPLFDKTNTTSANPRRPSSKGSSSYKESLPVISPLHRTHTPSILSRLWQTFTTPTPPTRPSHPVLQKLPLLPKYEPWTRTHYKVLDALWQHYKRHPSAFTPEDAENQGLLTPRSEWRRYVDVEFMNWGYGVRIDKPLVILAVLFSQLLVLESGREFERVQGAKIDGADVGPWASEEEGMEIGPLTVLVRLFSVVCGEMVRRDEARGRKIDRSEGGGDGVRWRFRGSGKWVWANMEVLKMKRNMTVVGK